MNHQLPLALDLHQAPRLEDFVVGPNQVVMKALRRLLDDGRDSIVFLAGASGCGRSHLLLGQCSAARQRGMGCAYLPLAQHRELSPDLLEGLEALALIAIDDVHSIAGETAWEGALFALFNRCQERGTRLLFSADRGPAAVPLEMPDMRSRLTWGLTLALQPLDDTDRIALLQSLATRRALDMPADVARYLLERSPRHPAQLATLVARLDRDSLAKQRRLTIPFVRNSLGL